MSDLAYPDQAYGELTAYLHVAGYTLERAFERIEALIAGDAWTRVGRSGFSDINVFMDSIRLDQFKANIDQRQRIAKRIKELQPSVSNRAIGRALGVASRTIDRDLATNVAPDAHKNPQRGKAGATNVAPVLLSGADAAKRVANFERGPIRRAERRAETLRRIVDANPPLPTGRRYPVIYADPAWRFETWSRETGLDRAPEAHYETMELDAIKALDVASLAAGDSVLFLWATSPILPQALEVMGAWSFTYKTHLIWAKDRAGTGFWLRNRHELLLIGTRGVIPAPLPGSQGDSLIEAEVGGHSEKPVVFAELIERWYPGLPKIELFRRGPPRPGWAAWGNEATAP